MNYRLVSIVVDVMGDVFPELRQHQVLIKDVIKEEEESFGRTSIKVRIIMCGLNCLHDGHVFVDCELVKLWYC